MAFEFIDRLNVSDDERRKLRGLGARTPAALLAMRNASPAAFDAFFGSERAKEIALALAGMLSEQERARLDEPAGRPLATGARIGRPAPPVLGPSYDPAERDRLFAEIERLRRHPLPSVELQEHIADLEQKLAGLLKPR